LLARAALNAVYTIAGGSILIETDDDWFAQAVSTIFSGWFLHELDSTRSTAADAAIRIRIGSPPPHIPHSLIHFDVPEGGVCHLTGDGTYFDYQDARVIIGATSTVDVWLNKPYKAGSRVLAQVVSQAVSNALRRCELYEFHSAAVIPPNDHRAIAIAGESGSGKTTLTMQLARCGWSFLSDDTLLIDNKHPELELYALRRFFALRSDTVAALQLSDLKHQASGDVKARVSPNDLFERRQVEHAKPCALLFPSVTQKAVTEIRRISAADAMMSLLRLCPWAVSDRPSSTKHLSMLANLAKACDSFELFAGTDLLDDPNKVAELCLSCVRS